MHVHNMVNIGQNIKEELQRQERTVSWLARKLNCTRAAVYRIFNKNSIDTALLTTISQVLHRDFFRELSEDVEIDWMKIDAIVYRFRYTTYSRFVNKTYNFAVDIKSF